jgi:hypothetical protein
MALKNINKTYEACCSNKPRDVEFKKLLNLGIWEAKIALYRFLLEKPRDKLTINELNILEALSHEGCIVE